MVGEAKLPTETELNEAFELWHHNGQNDKKTGVEIGRSRKTIWRWAKKYDWVKRSDKITRNISRGVDRKIESEGLSNVKLAGKCLKKEADAYLRKDHDATGDLRAITTLMKYIDEAGKPNEIAEALRAAAKQDELPFDPDLAAECLDLLTEALTEQKERLDES